MKFNGNISLKQSSNLRLLSITFYVQVKILPLDDFSIIEIGLDLCMLLP